MTMVFTGVLDESLANICQKHIQMQTFPGCQIGYIDQGETRLMNFGRLTYENDSRHVSQSTMYDIASITKSIPTASIILKLIELKQLSLDDKVIDYLPELSNSYREQMLIRHLLTYTVIFDLPGGLAKLAKDRPDDMIADMYRTPLVAPPGERYWYTNLPAILLGLVAEKVCRATLDDVARRWFFDPLGMTHTWFSPNPLLADNVAPTEAFEDGFSRGEVHDEAARTMQRQGRVAGDAGVFSTAEDLLKFAAMLLANGSADGHSYFSKETIREMSTNQIASLGESTAMGWELGWKFFEAPGASEQLFGKTGFTGCVLLIDPKQQKAFVQLSNSTWPKRPTQRTGINRCRSELAEEFFAI
jgi:CubicO group peptidase (beta-lactamase class C family)